jgi:hypothetical protein
MVKLKADLNLINSEEELKAVTAYLKKIDDDYFKQFKTTAEMDEHIRYLNSRTFIDDLMKKIEKGN